MANQGFLQSLIKSGIYWGHQRSRRNPKMSRFIWGTKNNVNLINVALTASQLEKAAHFLEKVASEGKVILWVGTKKPAQEAVLAVATKLHSPYVTHRWIGGALSNFGQVKKSNTKLAHYQDVLDKIDKYPHYTKKEVNMLQKTVERLRKNVGGIKNLIWPVGAVVIIDIIKEHSALKEAAAMGIPVVALVDTNADPSLVDYVIPGNDDAPRGIKLVLEYLAEAVAKGQATAANKPMDQQQEAHEQSVELAMIEATSDEDESSGDRRVPRKPEGLSRIKSPGRKYDDVSKRRPIRKPSPKE